MSSTVVHHEPRPADAAPPRSLPWTGVGAGVLGAVATMMSSVAVTEADRRDEPARAVVEGFDGLGATLKASSALGLLAVGLLVVFMADLRRRLVAQSPPASVTPTVAWSGGVLAAALAAQAFVVAAISGLLVDEGYRDTTLEVFSALADNLAFGAWVPLGLTMAAVVLGAFRDDAAPRWLGAVSALALAALVVGLAVGLPFASWAIACPWLVVAGVAGARGTA